MRVRVLAAGVAYPNPLTREGVHPEKPLLRFRPRWDLIGAVDRLGKGISGIEPGQIIAALPISGAYRVTGSDSGAQPRQMAPTARDRFVHVRLAGGDLPEMPLGHRPIAQTADDRRIDVSSMSLLPPECQISTDRIANCRAESKPPKKKSVAAKTLYAQIIRRVILLSANEQGRSATCNAADRLSVTSVWRHCPMSVTYRSKG